MEPIATPIHYLEIVTPEVEATRQLYASAFGWQFQPPATDLGNAFVATLPGGSLCGIRSPMHVEEVPVVRIYLRVADLDAATQAAKRSGATFLLEAMDLAGWGRISIYELGGIQHGLWQVP